MSTTVPASTSARPSSLPGFIVLLAGVVTSAAVLWIVSVLADSGINVMGLYYFYLVPVGALLVGLFSGLGYAIASRKVNMTLTPRFVTSMVSISLLDYLANQYVTYGSLMERMHLSLQFSFLDYLRDTCENMTFNRGEGAPPGAPIGMIGYLVKGMEVLGYVAGATLPAKMALHSVATTPDCLKCHQYYVAKRFGYINAPEQWQDLADLPDEERILALKQSYTPLLERTEAIMNALEGKKFSEASLMISKLEFKAAMGNTGTVTFTLRKCPNCEAFHLRANYVGYDADGTLGSSRCLRWVESSGIPDVVAPA
jgi:hypothetical protein